MRNSPVILQAGLTEYEPAWEFLFRQIGIPWKVISQHNYSANDFSVIIVNSELGTDLQSNIQDFVHRGGSALFTTKAKNEIQSRRPTLSYITSIPPTSNPYYEYFDILDLYSSVTYFGNGDFVEIEQSGGGWKAFLGIDIEIVLNNDSKRKNFFRQTGRMPNEVVAKRNKNGIRQVIFSLLKTLHRFQEIPLVHQWYFPGSEPTIFTFRIDSDKGSQEQVEQIYRISNENNIPTTWFLDVKSHESWLPYFHKFTQQEIGLHCYEHALYRTSTLNQENFQKGLSLLQKHKIRPVGITAPTGEWNEAYAEAIEKLGFHYSSEFAYDYDNLPSFPFINNKFFSLSQMPIHPICIGTMLRARMSDDDMVTYFKSIIDSNVILNEPICFYHHPTHQHNGVFEEVFRYINERNIAKLSYAQYAAWWKLRTSQLGLFRFVNGVIEPLSESTDVHFRIIRSDKSESIITLNENIHLNDIPFKQTRREIVPNDRLMQSRKFDPKHLLQNALDWWIKTTE
ncbi:MAG: polysaccharide deacetylase family protein [Bacteroidota bacterium]